jgi:O-antigen/teichoic acid export membrane protein
LNPLRALASQTAIYGLSSIIGRFLNYLLVPLYTYTFAAEEYGIVSEFYAYAGFFSILLIFGLETGYFRFNNSREFSVTKIYSTAQGFVLLANIVFVLAVLGVKEPLAEWLQYPNHPEYLTWFALILAFDALAALPFARLRAENRSLRFAGIKLAEIFLNLGLNLFFLVLARKAQVLWPDSRLASLYDPAIGIGYIFLSNLGASAFKLLLLIPELARPGITLNPKILKSMLTYSLPMVIIGFAGMVNEMLDRALLKHLLPYDLTTNLRMLGIYGACYKLAILMSLFMQAFRYAGEPFFFSYARKADAKEIYALVMKYFVILCIFIFLIVTLYIDFFKYFIGKNYWEGLEVVPVLLMANLFLGIYFNLSIWYKLTNRTLMGAWVSLFGAGLTVLLNLWWIPLFGYQGSAWATLICYFSMAGLSYLLGNHYYPVPYPLWKIGCYVLIGLGFYALDREFVDHCGWNPWLTGSAFLMIYMMIATFWDLRFLLWKRQST